MAILGLYLVVIERGLRIAASAGDDFRSLLAAGLALVVGVQAFIIAAGNLKLIPLTGITLPFISYGGSSLLVNGIVVGLLLALSDKGVEPPPAPKPRRTALAAGALTAPRAAPDGAAAQPVSRSIAHVGLALTLAFGDPRGGRRLLAGRPLRGAVDRAGQPGGRRRPPRNVVRGEIIDRDGNGPRDERDRRERRALPRLRRPGGRAVVGYASRRYGTAGLERSLRRRADRPERSRPDPEPAQEVPGRPVRPADADAVALAAAPAGGDPRPRGGQRAPSSCSTRGPARSSPSPRPRSTTPRRSPTRPPRTEGSPRSATTPTSRSSPGRRRAATCRARSSRSSPRSPALAPARSTPTTTFPDQAAAEQDGPRRQRLPDPRAPRRPGADVRPRRRDGGLVEHLVRARRPRDRRRQPRSSTPSGWVRGAAAVRPADGRLAGDRRRAARRRAASRTTSSSRTPSYGQARDVRHAAPDGARRGDGGQRRRADAAATSSPR